jgi:nucleotide-binding universal stress UspA family protein
VIASPLVLDAGRLDEFRNEGHDRVARLLAQWGIENAQGEVALDATPADGLRRIASDRDAKLLVVGSHGRGTVRAALLGSTCHALVTDAPRPVVGVPTDDSEQR